MKLPNISGKEMIKYLIGKGFSITRQRGSHVSLHKRESGETILVVVPLKKEIKKGTLLSILRQAGIPREEFIESLGK